MIKSQNNIVEIFTRFQQQNPGPTTELKYRSDFELLIAVMLSAKTKDKVVNQVTNDLFSVANTPEKMLLLTKAKLSGYIKTIGLSNRKVNYILRTCHVLLDKFNGVIPDSREELAMLPGVGRKTANVILNTLWQQPTIAVDTHVLRVANRIGLINTLNALAAELALLKIIPCKFLIYAHHWLILHGKYVCTASQPKCNQCIIIDLCGYTGKIVSRR